MDSAAREFFSAEENRKNRKLKPTIENVVFSLANMALTSSIYDAERSDIFRPEICRAITTKTAAKYESRRGYGMLDHAHKLTQIQLDSMKNRLGSARASHIDLNFSTDTGKVPAPKLKSMSAERPHYQRHGAINSIAEKSISLASQSRNSLLSIATVLAYSETESTTDLGSKLLDNCSQAAVSSMHPHKTAFKDKAELNELALRHIVLDILQEALDTNELLSTSSEVESLSSMVESMTFALKKYHHKSLDPEVTNNADNDQGPENGTALSVKPSVCFDKFTEKILNVCADKELLTFLLVPLLGPSKTRFYSGSNIVCGVKKGLSHVPRSNRYFNEIYGICPGQATSLLPPLFHDSTGNL